MERTNKDKIIAWRDDLIAKPVGKSKIRLGDVTFDYEDGKTEWNMGVEFDSAARAKGFRSTKSIVDVFNQAIDYLERCAFLEVDMHDFDDDDERAAEIISKRDVKKIQNNFDQFKRDVLRAVGSGIYNMELGCGVYATYLYDQHSMKHVTRMYHGEREISHHEHRDNNMGMIAALVDLVNFLDHNKSHPIVDENHDDLLGYLNREVK